jgi:hypothetical protein
LGRVTLGTRPPANRTPRRNFPLPQIIANAFIVIRTNNALITIANAFIVTRTISALITIANAFIIIRAINALITIANAFIVIRTNTIITDARIPPFIIDNQHPHKPQLQPNHHQRLPPQPSETC